jgi:hypothetical protein
MNFNFKLSNKNILLLCVFVLLATFFACMITGDVYLTKIAFNSSAMVCESDVATSAPTGGFNNSIQNILNSLLPNVCVKLNSAEIGFIKFRVILYWIVFALLTIAIKLVIFIFFVAPYLALLIVIIGLPLWIFMLVGGIYITYFAFYSTEKQCNNSSYYCYNLSDSGILFSKISAILCYFVTLLTTSFMGYYLYKAIDK